MGDEREQMQLTKKPDPESHRMADRYIGGMLILDVSATYALRGTELLLVSSPYDRSECCYSSAVCCLLQTHDSLTLDCLSRIYPFLVCCRYLSIMPKLYSLTFPYRLVPGSDFVSGAVLLHGRLIHFSFTSYRIYYFRLSFSLSPSC